VKTEVKNLTILKENQIYNVVPDKILEVGIVKKNQQIFLKHEHEKKL